MHKSSFLSILIGLSLLFCINLLMISSIAPALLFKQISAWILGIVLFFIGLQINPKLISRLKWIFFVGSCLLLVTPILLQNVTRGSRRWINIGPLSIQPSEIVKPPLMLFLANSDAFFLHLIPVLIIMLQPDLGSALSVLFLSIPIFMFNLKFLKIGLVFLLGLILVSPLIWSRVLHDYQRQRIINFINPASDPLGKGYNVIQSKIAIGSGGFWGKGYKNGSQGQLLFLPEKHTDFIFAAIAEELGFFGVIVIVFSYYLIIKSLINKAFNSANHSAFLFTLGIAFQIWMQTFVNIGMNIGILPVTGIPLPFLSISGSSILALLFSLGIIFAV